MINQRLPRRTFFELCSALAAWMAAPAQQVRAAPQAAGRAVRNRKNFVAIQMKPHAWIDEGIEQCLDNLQKGAVNTIWAYTYDWEMGPRNTPSGTIPAARSWQVRRSHLPRRGLLQLRCEVLSRNHVEPVPIAAEKPFGFHIMQNMTFSPFYRAEEDYSKTKDYADYLKLATYNNAGGPRMKAYMDRLSATLFHDARPKDFERFYYKLMNYEEGPYETLNTTGLTPDYLAREVKRARAVTGPGVKLYPGVDIDVPTQQTDKRTKPDDVRRSVSGRIRRRRRRGRAGAGIRRNVACKSDRGRRNSARDIL